MLNMKKLLLMLTASALIFNACSSSKKTAATAEEVISEVMADSIETEYVDLNELEVVASRDEGPYRGSEKRVNDLLTTSLKVKFDWTKAYLMGEALMSFTPYFYPTSSLVLDAKGFDLNAVALVKNGQKTPVKYEYDGVQIFIQLDREYKRGEKYSIFVDYVAKPNELEIGGSEAITSDKGLYFINPDGSEDKPQQIWTQGETEASSCWFPTIDSPNERTTQEIFITVQDKYLSLSNGKLVGSSKNPDGTRTDHWKQDIPHAPYLFMMTVGDFAMVKDTWKGIEVNYYVEREYEPWAKQIFPNTTEMLTFFSDVLDYPYPWDKYSQIIVRDYVSGAMENTGAVIYGDFVQGDDRELLDYDGEDIVAHELFHHWFGDLVTCESWSNLPLNESFATYGEYLWLEYKYGMDEADNHLRQDLAAYLAESEEKKKNLVRFHYDDKEDMFDRHSYQKGGRVLHMLRKYVGDDAFFQSLSKYLKDNEYKSVEIHNLRLAFEEVTGEDMNWFFNQWFLGSGHPVLDIDYDHAADGKTSTVMIKQLQDEDVFELPMAIDLYFGDQIRREYVVMNEREQSFEFEVERKPDLINVDGDKMLLCEKKDNKSDEEYLHQAKYAALYMDRNEVLWEMKDKQNKPEVQEAFLNLAKHEYWATAGRAAQNLDLENKDVKAKAKPILIDMAKNSDEAYTRGVAYTLLGSYKDAALKDLFVKGLNDKSYNVLGQSLSALTALDKDAGMKEAKKLEDTDKDNLITSLSKIYGENGGVDQLAFFEEKLTDGDLGGLKYGMFQDYGLLLGNIDDVKSLKKGVEILGKGAVDMEGQWWLRMSAMQSLSGLKSSLGEKISLMDGVSPLTEVTDLISKAVGEAKEVETNPRLQMMYQMMD